MSRAAPRGAEPPPIELRIVVDGASTAGKTTTARSLGERLGRPVHTPEEHEGRTLLFDWLDHEGGRSDGRSIRTQVVAVPGHLPHLRARLLVTADVVLFVADTSASGMRATEVALAQVRTLLDAYDGIRPGLLIQANKRDATDALSMDEVHARLGTHALGGDEVVIETVATTGDGVRQSYVYAVRLGLQHARAVEGPRIADRQATAEALLRELDRDPRPVRTVPTARATEPEAEAERKPEPEAELEPEPEPEPELEPEPEPEAELEPEPEPEAELEPEPEPEEAPQPEPEEEPEAGSGSVPVAAPMPALVAAGAAVAVAPTAPTTVGGDAPDHDHPRAWRRWFDR